MLERGSSLHFKEGTFLSLYRVAYFRFLYTTGNFTRELKIETFSGWRRLDWQTKPGTEAAVACRQNSNINIAVNSEGRRLRRIPKRKIWLHIKSWENKYLLCRQHVPDEVFRVLWENCESKNSGFRWDSYDQFTLENMRDEAECKAEFRVEKKISTGLPKPCKFQEH